MISEQLLYLGVVVGFLFVCICCFTLSALNFNFNTVNAKCIKKETCHPVPSRIREHWHAVPMRA